MPRHSARRESDRGSQNIKITLFDYDYFTYFDPKTIIPVYNFCFKQCVMIQLISYPQNLTRYTLRTKPITFSEEKQKKRKGGKKTQEKEL